MSLVAEPGKLTPADELRELLDRAERRLANVNSANADQVFELFEWLDQISQLVAELEAAGVDLRPERTRLESIEGVLRRKSGAVVRKVGFALPKRREELKPDESRWWWWLDRIVLERTRQRVRRAAITLAILIVVGAVGYFALTRLLPSNPQVAKAQGFQLAGENMVQSGDWAGAEQQFAEALKYTPDDPLLWVWLGAVREKRGNQSGAKEAFAKARELSSSELDYYLAKGQVYTQIGDAKKALAEAQKAVKIAPDSARAHFILASALELTGKRYDAIQEFQKAADLASDKDPQLVVLARMRMGMLMQMPGMPAPTGTITATVVAP